MPLSFHVSWMSVLIAVAVMAGGFVLCRLAYIRHKKRSTLLLEGLRMAILAFGSSLLFQPEWVVVTPPSRTPEIVILHDASGSMDTEDVRQAPERVITRRRYVDDLLAKGFGDSFKGTGHLVRVLPFSPAPSAGSPDEQTAVTDLAAPIDDVLGSSDNIRAVIMLGDGLHNAPGSPLSAAQAMRSRNIPFFAVPVGSETPLPDLSITDVQAPTYGIVGEMVQIPFSVRSTMEQDITTQITLRSPADGTEKTIPLHIPAHGEASDSIIWKIPDRENNRLELSVPVQPGELLEPNNNYTFTLSGRDEAINVLVIDTLPRWEYRFIRNALHRDPGVHVNTLLLHPGLDIPGEGPGYLTRFPESLEDLSRYDVVFVGDVGLGGKGLSSHQASLLKGLVANQAGGLVLLPGHQGNQFQLLDSDLGALFPVTFERGMPQGTTSSEVMSLALTREGNRSLLTLLSDHEEENDLIWRNLPGFNWYAPVQRAKAGTQVLAVHATRKNRFGRIPLLVTQPYGNGKVLFMGIDSAWRWRKDVEDKYHYRFWGQVARWMSYRRNMAAGERIRLMVTPERPRPGDTVNLTAIVSDRHGAPLAQGEVYADIAGPDGKSIRQQLAATGSSWGAFSTSFQITRSGTWSLTCVSMETPDKPVSMSLVAPSEAIERIGIPVNADLLAEMAAITRGRIIPIEDIDGMAAEIRRLPAPLPQEKRILLWSHPAVLAFLLVLLCAFWTGRKLRGSI